MKTYLKLLVILLLAGVTGFAVNNAFAQRPIHIHGDERTEAPGRTGAGMIGHITDTLAETDTPLTAEQITALEDIEPGRGARHAAMDILTENQRIVLSETWKTRRQGSGDDGPEGLRPGGMNREAHLEHLEQILSDTNQLITNAQKEQLAALEPGPDSRGKLHDILTDEQVEALHANRPPRSGRGDGRREPMPGGRHRMIGHVLDEAGCPLSDAQKEQLAAIEPGDTVREQVESILTDEQKDALAEARENAPRGGRNFQGRHRNPELLFEVLKDAGQPLSDAQKTAINEIERGPEHRAKLMDILTDDQKEALKATAKEHRGKGRHRNRSGAPQGQYRNFPDESDTAEAEKPAMLKRNYPNPFNPSTTIVFATPEAGYVTLDIYNIEGQRVRTLVDHHVSAGTHTAVWNGTNDLGQQVSAGQYFYTLRTDDAIETQKMVFIK